MKSEDIITSDNILGKEVVAPNGDILGYVTQIHIDRKTKEVIGITIYQTLFDPDFFIGINYIDNFGINVVLLNKVPLEIYKGRKVITEDGLFVGYVKDIIIDNDSITKIHVGPKYSFKKNFKEIDGINIKELGSVIVLDNILEKNE